ncbi:hypothetical protein GRX03_04745 [Halovenus sp. WSH3]|uniref:DUF7992 domain-containing protein n=1 Tax=Halovenus carboxidivorans TaxID=2692199 RepID=A0A6B0T410_9EURY|nr:hypothetical protein [Halovenus carboxidivorans]MXR50916.1 hypothetical protein [Halovenus carboxidivorans]
MSLDVAVPDPPELEGIDPNEYDDAEVVGDTDYKRDELEQFLEDGAWEEAFRQWAEETDMDESDFEIMLDLEMIQQFDFFWDSFAERVGYHAPGIPENWKERNYHPDIESWGTVSSINASLTELGQIVCDVLKDEYIDWETEYDAPDDLPDF